jgi:hypothetical protein
MQAQTIPSQRNQDHPATAGHSFGLAFRRCVSTGANAEAGCPSSEQYGDVVLDARGYTSDGGGLSHQGV